MSVEKFEKKYKGMSSEELSKCYYHGSEDEDSVMGDLLSEMEDAIDDAVEIVDEMKENSDEEIHVDVFIDQENLKIQFFTSEFDEEACEYSLNRKLFHEHIIGEPMAEAMFLIEKLQESGRTGMRQAINNWVADLADNLRGFGDELGGDYDISDSYGAIDY